MVAESTHHVLALEDEVLLLQAILATLATLPDVEVVGVSTVAAALAAIDARRPDLLISDLSLPDGTGLQVLQQLERLRHRIPVIIQTGQLSQFRHAIAEHPRLVILEKPVSMKELRNQVAVQLGAQRRGERSIPSD